MEIIKLNLIPSGVNPVCHCSQYDAGRVIRFELFDGLTPYTLSSEDEITLKVRKPDNTIVTAEVENTEDNYIDITTTEQMTACFGNNICELNITTDNKVIGSLNFVMIIEKDPIANGDPSQSVIKDLDALVAEAVEADLGDDYYTKSETDDKIDEKISQMGEDYVSIDGEAQVTPINLQIVKGIISPNLINPETVTNGKYIQKDGTEQSGNYNVTDYIAVESGKPYWFTWGYNNTRQNGGMRFLACYDADKNIMSDLGSNVSISSYPYIIPSGVRYLRISYTNLSGYSNFQFEQGTIPTDFTAYGSRLGSIIDDDYIDTLEIVEGQNILNQNAEDFSKGKYLNPNGNINDNSAYNISGYISVKEGDNLILSYKTSGGGTNVSQMRTVCCYNENKDYMSGRTGVSVSFFTVPSGVSYVRVCYHFSTYGYDVQLQKVRYGESFYPYLPYEDPSYKVKEDFLTFEKPIYAYLPPHIYVAIGRTIELYNELVVLDYEKYHFQWICPKGSAYKRKFSITGDTAGDLSLQLNIFDDKKRLCWTGLSTIHIVSASNPSKKVLPIGDSLTNWKAWLPEVMLLSSNNISFIGTRYSGQSQDSEGNIYQSGEIHHEGRSGWAASNYLTDSSYTFDNRYDGVVSVDGSANPFWDGNKFSLSHYLSVQTGVDTPDAVQIFLGTNDLSESVESAITNIAALVNSIRSEFANMPIFICNTIYRSNQNGYGSVGNDAYTEGSGANSWQYDQDSKIQALMIGLHKVLYSVANVYFIPLATCMDREYNFGQVMTKVNPRSEIEIPLPNESIHPQAAGYYQMADLMYSFYCGILS